MSVRDRILPVVDRARAKIAQLGLRRYRAIIRRRTWAGRTVGDTAGQNPGFTNTDVELTPTPKVELLSPVGAQMAGIIPSGGSIEDRYFKISGITPQYSTPTGARAGGYTPADLKLAIPAGVQNQEVLVVLVGDDGKERPCTLVLQDFSKPFRYELTVRLKHRDA
jgi:hypothetical protein